MRKFILLLLSLMLILSTGTIAFGLDEEPPVSEEDVEEYSSVSNIYTSLTKSGSTANCTVRVREKVDLDSVYGTFKLLNSSGTTISSDSQYLTKHGSLYTYSHGFSLPSSGTYKVKIILKTYKNGVLKETITCYTNTVTK